MAVTIIDIRSLSYTGTTWVNLLAASHEKSFGLIAPQRLFAGLRGEVEPEKLCMIHRERCDFWPDALPRMSPDDNSYRQVAEQSGCSHVALNNPFVDQRGVDDLQNSGCNVVSISIVRDARATVASYMTYHKSSAREGIDWLSAGRGLASSPPDVPSIRLRYEDMVANQLGAITQIGEFVGLDYGERALRYWEFDHHPVGGNPGPFKILRRHLRNKPVNDDKVEDRYQRLLADPTDFTLDEKWRRMLTETDLKDLDREVGDLNREWGYQ